MTIDTIKALADKRQKLREEQAGLQEQRRSATDFKKNQLSNQSAALNNQVTKLNEEIKRTASPLIRQLEQDIAGLLEALSHQAHASCANPNQADLALKSACSQIDDLGADFAERVRSDLRNGRVPTIDLRDPSTLACLFSRVATDRMYDLFADVAAKFDKEAADRAALAEKTVASLNDRQRAAREELAYLHKVIDE